MPSADYEAYQKYYALNPWGLDREDWRAANIAWILFAANCKTRPEFKEFLWKAKHAPIEPIPIPILKAKLDSLVARNHR